MLAGGEIFRLIEQDQKREAVNLLESTLKVISRNHKRCRKACPWSAVNLRFCAREREEDPLPFAKEW